MTRRAKAEALFFQSQKLEAIGRLSGGIAHDFNNLLTVIMGHSEMAKLSLSEQDPIRADLDGILDAAQRAAGLTRQLLAFARKQIVEPKRVRIEDRILLLEPMLRRLLGEQIRIRVDLSPDPRSVRIDPVQLEQVLMNLAVNARDAMPDGGTLTIGTSTVMVSAADRLGALGLEAGEHVSLRVSDTGLGMDAATLASAFEPFFTTKAPGKGTGLGLATCYGIVRQAGGSITVRSEPGEGTVFEILLPVTTAAEAPKPERASPSPRPGVETVLVVDDEASIRELIARILRAHGYTVLVASSMKGAEALARSHTGGIGLVLTDVVMPDADGRQLVDSLRRTQPRMAALYVSGYSDDIIARHGILQEGVNLLAKPFTPEELARRVREALDAQSVTTGSGATA